jgi:hypothetical protein
MVARHAQQRRIRFAPGPSWEALVRRLLAAAAVILAFSAHAQDMTPVPRGPEWDGLCSQGLVGMFKSDLIVGAVVNRSPQALSYQLPDPYLHGIPRRVDGVATVYAARYRDWGEKSYPALIVCSATITLDGGAVAKGRFAVQMPYGAGRPVISWFSD